MKKQLSFFFSLLVITTVINTMEQADLNEKALYEAFGISKNASPDEIHNTLLKAMRDIIKNDKATEEKLTTYLKSTSNDYCSLCASQILRLNPVFNFIGKTPCCESPINLCDKCKNSVGNSIQCPNSNCCQSLDVIRNFNGITLNKVKK